MIHDLPKNAKPQPDKVVRQFISDMIDLAEKSGMPFGQCLIACGLMAKSVAKMYVNEGADEGEAMHFVLGYLMEGLGFRMEEFDGDEGQVH